MVFCCGVCDFDDEYLQKISLKIRDSTVSSGMYVGCVYRVQVLKCHRGYFKLKTTYKNTSFQVFSGYYFFFFITAFTPKGGSIKLEYKLKASILICKYLLHLIV